MIFFKTLNENWKTHFISTFTLIVNQIRFIITFLSASFRTSSLFRRSGLIHNIVHLPFFIARSGLARSKKHLLWASPVRPVGKPTRHLPARPIGNFTSHVPRAGYRTRARTGPMQTSTGRLNDWHFQKCMRKTHAHK